MDRLLQIQLSAQPSALHQMNEAGPSSLKPRRVACSAASARFACGFESTEAQTTSPPASRKSLPNGTPTRTGSLSRPPSVTQEAGRSGGSALRTGTRTAAPSANATTRADARNAPAKNESDLDYVPRTRAVSRSWPPFWRLGRADAQRSKPFEAFPPVINHSLTSVETSRRSRFLKIPMNTWSHVVERVLSVLRPDRTS